MFKENMACGGEDAVLCIDRYFTSIQNQRTLLHWVLVLNSTMQVKLKQKNHFQITELELLCVKWQDTKEAMIISNCYKPNIIKQVMHVCLTFSCFPCGNDLRAHLTSFREIKVYMYTTSPGHSRYELLAYNVFETSFVYM